jgi:hypothetical protein
MLCNKFIFLGLLTKFLGLSLGQAQDFEKSPISTTIHRHYHHP